MDLVWLWEKQLDSAANMWWMCVYDYDTVPQQQNNLHIDVGPAPASITMF